jgi:hypothetical protein
MRTIILAVLFNRVGSSRMSDNQDFKDSSSKRHLAMILVTVVAMPLLPMLMGWFTILS